MQVSSLSVYPIKSVAPIHLERAQVEARGLAGDRRYLLVDANGRFITGREQPDLVLVSAQLTERGLALSAPGMEPLLVATPDDDQAQRAVRIWRDDTTARSAGEAPSAWFSQYLGVPCSLVYQAPGDQRVVQAADGTRDTDLVSFADGYPVLLIGSASLDDLNSRLDVPVAMGRFRTNIVAATAVPFIEDTWRRICIGDVTFDVVKRCARCVFTTVDPLSGQRDEQGEPLKTLRSYRLDKAARGVMFGVNMIARNDGRIERGAPIEVLETTA